MLQQYVLKLNLFFSQSIYKSDTNKYYFYSQIFSTKFFFFSKTNKELTWKTLPWTFYDSRIFWCILFSKTLQQL